MDLAVEMKVIPKHMNFEEYCDTSFAPIWRRSFSRAIGFLKSRVRRQAVEHLAVVAPAAAILTIVCVRAAGPDPSSFSRWPRGDVHRRMAHHLRDVSYEIKQANGPVRLIELFPTPWETLVGMKQPVLDGTLLRSRWRASIGSRWASARGS